MSIHPSLTPTKGKKHRSVLKRFERIESLRKDGKWKEGDSSFNLPKSKIIKMKIKKTKAVEAKTAAEGAAAPAAGAAAGAGATPAKGAAAPVKKEAAAKPAAK